LLLILLMLHLTEAAEEHGVPP